MSKLGNLDQHGPATKREARQRSRVRERKRKSEPMRCMCPQCLRRMTRKSRRSPWKQLALFGDLTK